MAINSFDEALALIKDPEKAKIFKEVVDELPDLKGGWLRQSDYSRHLNTLQDKEKQLEKDIGQLQQWREWRSSNWDEEATMTKQEVEARRQLTEAQSELEVLRAAQEAGMTFEEVSQYIDKELTKKNVVTRDYIEKDFRAKLLDEKDGFYQRKDVDAKITGIANGLEYLYEETFPLGFSHRDEFGEVLKPKELITFANEKGYKDISQAYDAWVAPKRTEISKKKNEEALAKAREEGRAEAKKEQAMGQGGKLPTDSGPPVMGHLEQRLRLPKNGEGDKPSIPEDMPLGTVGGLVAQQYRKDMANGVVLKD